MRLLPLLLLAFAAPAYAQEIIVTGERRAQDVETLTGNTARMSGEELARVDAQVASEALNRLPGVAIHRNNGVENLPAIRSPVLVGGQSAGSFLVLEDGVPIRAPGFGNVNDLFETSLDFADAVEVVRGPGSALYGSNAVHGIVNVITMAPLLSEWAESEDLATLSVASFGRTSGTIYASRRTAGISRSCHGSGEVYLIAPGGLGAAALGLSVRHDNGWRAQSGIDEQSAMFGWTNSWCDWDADVRAVFQNLNQETAGFITGSDAYRDSALARTNSTPEASRDQQLARVRATFSRSFGDAELRITPYARWIDARLRISFLPSRALEETRQSGGGVQSALYWDADERLSLIVGADVDATRGRLREFQDRPDQPNGYVQGLHYDYAVDMLAAAMFAQARWTFAPDWTLSAGLRGEHVRYEYDNRAPDGDVGRFRRASDRSDEFEALTPKLGLVWRAAPGQQIYLNLARGARPPQITDLYSLQILQTPGAQGVETLDSAEVGWRGAFGGAQLEAALYHMDKSDTSFRNADGFTVTDGRTRHQGVELSASAPLGERFALAGWVSYARHSYRFADPSARAGETIVTGNDVDSAPRWLWNARAEWRLLDPLTLELEWAHMGRYFTNAENTRTYPGHDVFNLRADYALREGVVAFAAIRNLTNTDYAERADFAFGEDRYFPGEDRGVTFGMRLQN